MSVTVNGRVQATEPGDTVASLLDRLGLEGHGVHPDVPKNVSKSITVD